MRGNQENADHFAELIFRKLSYRGTDARFFWQAAELAAAGLITGDVIHDAIQGTGRFRPRNPVAYFRRCIENSIGGKERLEALLTKIRVPRDRCGPPAPVVERQRRTAYDDVNPKPKTAAKPMGDVMGALLAELAPGVVIGDDLPAPEPSFATEREKDPQRLVDELRDQNARQRAEFLAKLQHEQGLNERLRCEIHRLKQETGRLEGEIAKLRRGQGGRRRNRQRQLR